MNPWNRYRRNLVKINIRDKIRVKYVIIIFSMTELKQTALYNEHIALGAKMVSFAGWEMPVSYKGIISEHTDVRTNAGIFDIGHMGVVDISFKGQDARGKGENVALSFLLSIATNDARLLSENECQYSILCNERGGAVDDILVYKLNGFYRIVVNASNTDKAIAWFKAHVPDAKARLPAGRQVGSLTKVTDSFTVRANLSIKHRTDISMLSLQGPKAVSFVPELSQIKHNHCGTWQNILVSRTGYTGEDGFEFFTTRDEVLNVWNHFISLGISPCGLGARDTLRLEAGLPLYGHEYDDNTSPIEAGYPWAVKFEDHEFVGKAALLAQKQNGPARILKGLKFSGKAIPRQGAEVFAGDKKVGVVTSGTFSPTLKIPVALAYLNPQFAQNGLGLSVLIRDKLYPAVVCAKKMV